MNTIDNNLMMLFIEKFTKHKPRSKTDELSNKEILC